MKGRAQMGGRILTVLVLLALAAVSAFWLLTRPVTIPAVALTPHNFDLKNGETMFNVGGCASCHATPAAAGEVVDRTKLGGGLALKTPFGVFKAPNISQHKQTGIGDWTELQFVNAMMRGVGRAGEHLYPAFPYPSYQRMRLGDVRDLYAYMKTLPAVARPSEPHELAFPYNMRRGLGLWKLLYVDGREFQPDPARSAALNRGAYLVEGPGHCAECHSPRNLAGGIDADRRFAGGPNPEGKGFVPNITPHKDGIGDWAEDDIAYMLETGLLPDGDSVGGSMADVAINTGALSEADRTAIAAYLKSLPKRETRK